MLICILLDTSLSFCLGEDFALAYTVAAKLGQSWKKLRAVLSIGSIYFQNVANQVWYSLEITINSILLLENNEAIRSNLLLRLLSAEKD